MREIQKSRGVVVRKPTIRIMGGVTKLLEESTKRRIHRWDDLNIVAMQFLKQIEQCIITYGRLGNLFESFGEKKIFLWDSCNSNLAPCLLGIFESVEIQGPSFSNEKSMDIFHIKVFLITEKKMDKKHGLQTSIKIFVETYVPDKFLGDFLKLNVVETTNTEYFFDYIEVSGRGFKERQMINLLRFLSTLSTCSTIRAHFRSL